MSIQDTVRKALKKSHGSENVSLTKELRHLASIPYGISAQCLSLDLLIGRPGFPAGRLSEIVGLDGKSKSSHGFHILAETQRLNGIGVLVETEQAFELERLEKLGITPDDLIICHPETLEQAFAMMEQNSLLIRQNGFTGPISIVFDSVAGTPTRTEAEGEYDDNHMAAASRVISQSLRKLIRVIADQKIVLVFLNQLKSTMVRYGEEYESYGGRAIKYHASVRIQVHSNKSGLQVDANKHLTGVLIKTRNIKNKVASPFKTAEYILDFDSGLDIYDDVQRVALTLGVVTKRQGKIYFQEKLIAKSKWKTFVDKKYAGPFAFREVLEKEAIQQQLLKPYVNTIEE